MSDNDDKKLNEDKKSNEDDDNEEQKRRDRSWTAIVDVVRSQMRKRINAVVFRYISEQAADKSTSEAICALEERLRSEDIELWCMAHPIAPPDQLARSLRGEPCNYYLVLALSETDRDKFLRDKACTSADNCANLRATGFQATSSKTSSTSTASGISSSNSSTSQKVDYLEFPADLHGERDSHFDDAAIRFYDTSLTADLFRRHAKEVVKASTAPAGSQQQESREKRKSKLLNGTGVQVVRTSVPTSRWSETRAAIVEQARTLQPIADMHIVGSVREQVIPLGFALHGVSSTPLYLGGETEAVCLFDLYCCTVRRYHIDVSQADADVLTSSRSQFSIGTKAFHEVIARCAGTIPEEVEHITADRLERFVCYRVVDNV